MKAQKEKKSENEWSQTWQGEGNATYTEEQLLGVQRWAWDGIIWVILCRQSGTDNLLHKYWILLLLKQNSFLASGAVLGRSGVVGCNLRYLPCFYCKRGRENQLDITDIYTVFYPEAAEYTFFSSIHGILSRIDHTLGHKTSLNKFRRIKIIQCMFSESNKTEAELWSSQMWKLNNIFLNNK